MYFYELHEGDDEIFSDVLLARETEMEPDDFFELVQSIRRRVQDTYEHDTLIEAIAAELERDARLRPRRRRPADGGGERLADRDREHPHHGRRRRRRREADEDRGADYRAIIAEFDPARRGRPRTN